MPPNAAHTLASTPLPEITTLLLKQFRRLLLDHGVKLTDTQITSLSTTAAAGDFSDPQIAALHTALLMLIGESETVLFNLKLTFPEALFTDMNALGGWQTTAEFLEIANEKSNAELRIAGGAALLALLGGADAYPATLDYLRLLAEHPELDDVNAAIAVRVLAWLGAAAPGTSKS